VTHSKSRGNSNPGARPSSPRTTKKRSRLSNKWLGLTRTIFSKSGLYRQGIWNYVGRAQYNTGKLLEARKSLERALSVYQDDHLAKLYLGLTRARSDDSANGARDIESGMKGLYDWLEHYESTKPFEAFWDPRREIRSAIEKDLKMISSNKIDWQQLIPNAEWLGQRFEDEIDQVRRQESRQQR
jgi:tetratricopeptide (TPR) repeat protein